MWFLTKTSKIQISFSHLKYKRVNTRFGCSLIMKLKGILWIVNSKIPCKKGMVGFPSKGGNLCSCVEFMSGRVVSIMLMGQSKYDPFNKQARIPQS